MRKRIPRSIPLSFVLIVAALATGLATVSAANSQLLSRSLTLTARTHTVTRGQRLLLHGTFRFELKVATCPASAPNCILPAPIRPPNPRLYARYGNGRRFWPVKRIEHVSAATCAHQGPCSVRWSIWVTPGQNVAYRAVAKDRAGIWQRAATKPFRVVVS